MDKTGCILFGNLRRDIMRETKARRARIAKEGYKRKSEAFFMRLVRLFFKSRLIGGEYVTGEGGHVFVCNHENAYGPVISKLFLPCYSRPWTIHSMTEKKEIAKEMELGIGESRWIPKVLAKPISRLVAPIVYWAIRSCDPIPVYRENPKKVLATLKESVDTLCKSENITLFPENPWAEGRETYAPGQVHEFFTGFVALGKYYYQHTKKHLNFYPVYIDRRGRRVTIGEPIAYDISNPLREEKKRVAGYLYNKMVDFSGRAAGK